MLVARHLSNFRVIFSNPVVATEYFSLASLLTTQMPEVKSCYSKSKYRLISFFLLNLVISAG